MKQAQATPGMRELTAQQLEEVSGGVIYTYLGKEPDWSNPFEPVADMSTGGATTDPTATPLISGK